MATLEGTITLPTFPEDPPQPTAEQLVGPVLLGWSTTGDDNAISYDANMHSRPVSLTAIFSGTLELAATDGAHSVTNLANWQLLLGDVDVSNQIAAITAQSQSLSDALPTSWATITFAAPLAPGTYRLIARDTIQASDGRLLNGDGNLTAGGDAPIDFQVSPFRATTRENSAGGGYVTPVVATDGQGNSVVVSISSVRDSTGQLLQVERFDAQNKQVGSAIQLGEIRGDQVYSGVHVSMAADGSFAVAWRTTNFLVAANGESPSFTSIQRFSADGTPLGQPFGTGLARSSISDLSLAEDGSLVVVSTQNFHWSFIPAAEQDPQQGPTVYVSRFDAAGQEVDQPTRLGLGGSGQVARRSDGSFVVVWADGSRPSRGILAQGFSADGELDGPVVVVSSRPDKSSAPVVAIDPQGNAVIAWLYSQGDESSILLQRLSSDGKWLGPESIVSTAEKPVDGPRLAMGADGRFFIGWAVQTDAFSPVRIRAFDPAATPLETLLVVGDGRAQPTAPGLAVDDSGAVIAIWRGAQYIDRDANTGEIKFVGDPSTHLRHFEMLDWNASADLNGERQGTDYRAVYVPGGSAAAPIADPNAARVLSSPLAGPLTLQIQIDNPLPGDVLEVESVAGWQYDPATFTGTIAADDFAVIEQVLRKARFRSTADRPAGSEVRIRSVLKGGAEETAFSSDPSYTTISVHQPGTAQIVGRYIFYNNSGHDGNDTGASAADDAAIAPDKTALQPRTTTPFDSGISLLTLTEATFENITSYAQGINGVMFDLAGAHRQLTAEDFVFRVGNSDRPGQWAYAPPPRSISVRAGAGVDGSDRVVLIWDDGAITNSWLQIVVLANGNTGLAQRDIFYFGNRVGDSGNETARSQAETRDALALINQLRSSNGATGVAIDNPYDFNRDGRLNSRDLLTLFNEIRAVRPALEWIQVFTLFDENGDELDPVVHSPLVTPGDLPSGIGPAAGPLAAVLAEWDDHEMADARVPLIAASLLMEEPEEI